MRDVKISAVVVTYNPTSDVIENIKSYLSQVDQLLVFDNSESYHAEVIDWIKRQQKIIYKSDNYNHGIGYALNYAADYFMKLNFDYLLTMDQDSQASKNMVENMLEGSSFLENVAIISPFPTNKFNTKKSPHFKYQEMINVKTSGNLLSLSIFQKIGRFNEKYFIDFVDIEYGYRIRLTGYKIIQVNDVLLFHNEADISRKKILWRTFYPYNHNPRRMYYKTRNLLYLRDDYKRLFPSDFRDEKNEYKNNLFKILLFEKDKREKIRMIWDGYRDYKKRITGRNPRDLK